MKGVGAGQSLWLEQEQGELWSGCSRKSRTCEREERGFWGLCFHRESGKSDRVNEGW